MNDLLAQRAGSPRQDRGASSHQAVPRPRSRSRKRKKKHSSRRRSSSRSDSSSRSSDFQLALNRSAGQENAIQQLARKSPGKLLRKGLEAMYGLCNPASAAIGGESPAIPATAVNYLQSIVKNTLGVKLNQRDARELETLAATLDLLANGNFAGVGDILIQRFKSLETDGRAKNELLGQHMEILPSSETGATSLREREVAAKMALRSSKLEEAGRRRH